LTAQPEKPNELVPGGASYGVDFRGLYDTHFRMVHRALQCRGVRSADLMDMTQKVFLVAFLRLPEFEGRSTLARWLRGICRRVAWGYRRSGIIEREISTDPHALSASCRELDVTAADVVMVRQAELERLLNKLSAGERTAFLLVELAELDGPEVAAGLNLPLGTVRSRLRRARAKFQREAQRATVRQTPG